MKRLLILLLVAACGEASESRSWSGTIETLPSGVTRVTSSGQGVWEDGEGWRLTPEVVIGVVDGVENEIFAAPAGLEVGPDGRIYILDRQLNELRIFGPDGTFIRSVGRAGGGPGEYQNANGLLWVAEDTLAVVDQRGGRYSLLTADGEYVRSIPRQLGFYGYVARAHYAQRHIYEMSVQGDESDPRPVLIGTPLSGTRTEVLGDSAARASALAETDTIPLPIPTGSLYESFVVRSDRGGMVMQVPFTTQPDYHIDQDGQLWHGHGGEEFRIAVSTLEGDTIREMVVLDAAGVPVTPEEIAEWESLEFVSRFQQMGGKIDRGRIPSSKPFFDDLYRDPDGYLWAAMPAAPMQVAFSVFDPDGRFLGRLQVSGMERNGNVSPVVRNGRLHFVGRDELDVSRVYALRIDR